MPEDFKASTRAMLEVVRGEKARLQKRMDELDSREATILKWIEDEEGPQREIPMAPPDKGLPVVYLGRRKPTLQELFREVMQDGRPRSNSELAEVAKMRGIVGNDVDLRSINSTMLSLMNSHEVERKNDKWVRKGA